MGRGAGRARGQALRADRSKPTKPASAAPAIDIAAHLNAIRAAEAVVEIRAQHLVDRAIAASADDMIVAATVQPSKEATRAAEVAPVATAEIDETMIYVHVAEDHRRDMPDRVLAAAAGKTDPERRILLMLGSRGSNVAVNSAPTDQSPTIQAS